MRRSARAPPQGVSPMCPRSSSLAWSPLMQRATLLQRTFSRLGFLRGDAAVGCEVRGRFARRSRPLMVESLEGRSMLTAAYISISSSVNEGRTAFGAITLDEPSDDYVYVSWTTANHYKVV